MGKETLELPRETDVVLRFNGFQTLEVHAESGEGEPLPSSFFHTGFDKGPILEFIATKRGIELEEPRNLSAYYEYMNVPMRTELFRLGKWRGGFGSPEENVKHGKPATYRGEYQVRNRPGILWLLSDGKPIARTKYEADASVVRLRVPQ